MNQDIELRNIVEIITRHFRLIIYTLCIGVSALRQ